MKKRKKRHMSRHHRLARSKGGGNNAANISYVPNHLHQAYHLLFGNADAYEVAKIFNDTWIDTKYRLVVFNDPSRGRR